MKLRNEKFTNELLEKEIDKKKFKDKMQEGDLKLQIKQLSINLDKEQKQTEQYKSKLFDAQEEVKKLKK